MRTILERESERVTRRLFYTIRQSSQRVRAQRERERKKSFHNTQKEARPKPKICRETDRQDET